MCIPADEQDSYSLKPQRSNWSQDTASSHCMSPELHGSMPTSLCAIKRLPRNWSPGVSKSIACVVEHPVFYLLLGTNFPQNQLYVKVTKFTVSICKSGQFAIWTWVWRNSEKWETKDKMLCLGQSSKIEWGWGAMERRQSKALPLVPHRDRDGHHLWAHDA